MQKYFGQILEMRQQNNSSISDQQEIINKFSVAKARKLISLTLAGEYLGFSL